MLKFKKKEEKGKKFFLRFILLGGRLCKEEFYLGGQNV